MIRPFPRFAAPILTALAAIVLLASCAADETVGVYCPQVFIPQDTERLTRFRDGGGRDITDVRLQAEVTYLSGSCDVEEEAIVMDFPIAVGAERGPANSEGVSDVTLFVAVTTREREILSRRTLPITLRFPGNRTRVTASENLSIEIPKQPDQTGKAFLVFLGFELSRGELEFNRSETRGQ